MLLLVGTTQGFCYSKSMHLLKKLKDLLVCLAVFKNPIPYCKQRYIDVPRGRQHPPYVLRLRNGLAINISDVGHNWFSATEVFLNKHYTSSGQVIRAGDTVVDVGANIGCFSLLASQLVGPAGRVIALEPDPQTFAQLEANIKLNNATNIAPYCLALGESCGEATIFRHPNSLFSSLYDVVDGHRTDAEEVVIKSLTLEAFFNEHNIDQCQYLKLDCEGAEYAIVRSLSAELAERIEQITMEVHSISGESEAELDQAIQSHGFQLNDSGVLAYYFRTQAV
jgi:FkbM family methyltransferase